MTLSNFWSATDAAQASAAAIVRADSRLLRLYQHALSFESWRKHLLDSKLSRGLPFWYEAQNDYLLALTHGGQGILRSALQSLRSFLENATGAIYYSEHPVEAKRFELKDFRMTWSETKEYLASYPYSSPKAFRTTLWQVLNKEYSELSRAVHGSAESFRMTAGQQFPTISAATPQAIGAWATRMQAAARAVNLLLLQHFASELEGARLPALREDVSKALSATDRSDVRQKLSVVLPRPRP